MIFKSDDFSDFVYIKLESSNSDDATHCTAYWHSRIVRHLAQYNIADDYKRILINCGAEIIDGIYQFRNMADANKAVTILNDKYAVFLTLVGG